jgi:cytochrome c biogenesis factor
VGLYDASCSNEKAVLEPRLHEYPKFGQVIATPDVRTGLVDDVYVTIAGTDGDAIRLSVLVFPLQWLLWFGGLTMVAGGLVALGRKVRGGRPAPPPEQTRDEAHV